MKKQDIKADPIKDKIVEIVNFIVDNSRIVWLFLTFVAITIMVFSFYSTSNKKIRMSENLQIGILQNKSIHSEDNLDSLILEYESILLDFSPNESYNQAYIYLLNYYITNNHKDKIEDILFNNSFESNDDMQNSFIFKSKGDYYNNINNSDQAISFYEKAFNLVPSYDLKVLYCMELIQIYINNNDLDNANKTFSILRDEVENIDLSFTAKNNLDYIDSKLLHLVK